MNKRNYDCRIVVVDDCSNDDTFRQTLRYLAHHHKVKLYRNEKNMGKGYSIRKGLSLSNSDYYLFTDCDLSVSISEVDMLLNFIKYCDLVVGSRYVNGSVITRRQSLLRRFYSRCFNFLVTFIFNICINDTQCGFKLFTKKARNLILKHSVLDGFSFDVELFVIMKSNYLNYGEVGITWNDNKPQSFGFKKIAEMFSEITLVNRLLNEGKYKEVIKRIK